MYYYVDVKRLKGSWNVFNICQYNSKDRARLPCTYINNNSGWVSGTYPYGSNRYYYNYESNPIDTEPKNLIYRNIGAPNCFSCFTPIFNIIK